MLEAEGRGSNPYPSTEYGTGQITLYDPISSSIRSVNVTPPRPQVNNSFFYLAQEKQPLMVGITLVLLGEQWLASVQPSQPARMTPHTLL